MPSVDFNEDPVLWLQYIRSIYDKLPIELQLVWLYEILVKTCLLHHKELFRKTKTNYVISATMFEDLMSCSADEMFAIQNLCLFRNRYVHFSYYNITTPWKICLSYRDLLNAIAQRYGVTLNWSKTVALDTM